MSIRAERRKRIGQPDPQRVALIVCHLFDDLKREMHAYHRHEPLEVRGVRFVHECAMEVLVCIDVALRVRGSNGG